MTRAEQLAEQSFSFISGCCSAEPPLSQCAPELPRSQQTCALALRPLTEHWRVQRLHNLCADLIDYVSIGHFRIYGRILRNQPDHDEDLQVLIRHLLHNIGYTTDAVLAFNDRFANHTLITPQLTEELARLSRCLLLRFALEEQLLDLVAEAALQVCS